MLFHIYVSPVKSLKPHVPSPVITNDHLQPVSELTGPGLSICSLSIVKWYNPASGTYQQKPSSIDSQGRTCITKWGFPSESTFISSSYENCVATKSSHAASGIK